MIVMLWGITAPSYWRDESATLSAISRSFPQLFAMLGRVDAVHGLYYLLLWPVVHAAGATEFDTRLPSAIAMAAAALAIAAIGRRARSPRAGLYAGLVFASLPMVSVRGHDARPYAIETAAAVLSSYLLLRAAEESRPRRLAAYGLSLAALGYLHLFGLLIIPAHALALIPAARQAEFHGRARRLARRWLVTVAAAMAMVAPIAIIGWQQRVQIAWLPPPNWHDVRLLVTFLAAGTAASVAAIGLLILLGVIRGGRRDVLTWLAAPWLVLPPWPC